MVSAFYTHVTTSLLIAALQRPLRSFLRVIHITHSFIHAALFVHETAVTVVYT